VVPRGKAVLSLEQVYELLGVNIMPGTKADLQELVGYTQDVVNRNGEEYVRQNRALLLSQWDWIRSM
jgi:hypothetical protein